EGYDGRRAQAHLPRELAGEGRGRIALADLRRGGREREEGGSVHRLVGRGGDPLDSEEKLTPPLASSPLAGHAEKSGVVFVGDRVIKIGAVDVERMTLEEVVQAIVETKRPNIMILTSEHEIKSADVHNHDDEDGDDDDDGRLESGDGTATTRRRRFVSPLDLAFGFANRLVADVNRVGGDPDPRDGVARESGVSTKLKPALSMNSLLDDDDDGDDDEGAAKDAGERGVDREEEEVCFGTPSKVEIDGVGGGLGENPASVGEGDGKEGSSQVADYADAVEGSQVSRPATTPAEVIPTIASPTKPPTYSVETLLEYAAHRTNTHGDAETLYQRLTLLKRAALFDPEFRNALRLSLVECVADPRRYSFLEHFFKNYRSKGELEARRDPKRGVGDADRRATSEDEEIASSRNQRRLLKLYLELRQFHDVVTVCSASDREKLLDRARWLSTRFIPKDEAGELDANNERCLPEHVSYAALGGIEKVQAVRFSLTDEDAFFEGESGSDGFDDMRLSLEAFLSTQDSFLSFMLSDDCARMRAYLRGSSRGIEHHVQAHMFLKFSGTEDCAHHGILMYAILHLVCMKESEDIDIEENFIKNDALMLNSGKRNVGTSSLLCCAIFINRSLRSSIEATMEGLIEDGMTGFVNHKELYSSLTEDMRFLWEAFIAPAGGALSTLNLSPDVQEALDAARRLMVSSVDNASVETASSEDAIQIAMAKMLSSSEVSISLYSLAEALLREYTCKIYPNFKRHIFHEWASKEATKDHSVTTGEYMATTEFHKLSDGWVNRFLRQTDLPPGYSLHRPGPCKLLQSASKISPVEVPACSHSADVALVFGSDPEADDINETGIRRFSCVSLHPDSADPSRNVLLPEDIPPILETYAMVPPFHERPFQGMLQDDKNYRVSLDGWEVSLTNFVIPSQANGDSDDNKWMYCVSLIFRRSFSKSPTVGEREIDNQCVYELQYDESWEGTSSKFVSPVFRAGSNSRQQRKMKVTKDLKEFSSKLQGQQWSRQIGEGATIGLTLISSRNVMAATRDSLSLFYRDICSAASFPGNQELSGQYVCQPLVDLLGVLSFDVEEESLSCLLQPYIAHASSRWVNCALSDQSDIFMGAAGYQLLQALPPVPLALAFVTLLLEQKVVFSSSRRGMLLAASFAMLRLLKPLKWAHLHVPLVPASMMDELIHYPAPFVLGIPTDEKESASILSALPSDVTLVDLDVGRVILASVFSNDASKSTEGASVEAVAGALRSQVLFLAESLGGAFGVVMHRNSWCSDGPLQVLSKESTFDSNDKGTFTGVLDICIEFVSELLYGESTFTFQYIYLEARLLEHRTLIWYFSITFVKASTLVVFGSKRRTIIHQA
ncbi:hypothetical protein ACHAWF_008526, partial [Thalassiosira exigua]